MRNVGKKFLPHNLESLGSSDIEENSERSFGSISICIADRHDTEIEHLALWSMCFDFHAAALDPFQSIKERTVDRGIASQLSQSL